MADDSIDPELAIVLVTTQPAQLRKVLRCYRAQTDPQRLEIVAVALAGARIMADEITALGFHHVTVLALPGHDIALAEARAVQAATAPRVVFGQPHGYPRPGFVDAILSAARSGSWTVVGPVVETANPGSLVAWASACVHYTSWTHQRPRGPATKLPGHHSAYDRTAVLALGSTLPDHLPAGPALLSALRARGATFLLEPAAGIDLVYISRLGSFLLDQLLQGASYARGRRPEWSRGRRLIYAAGAPLIPFVWLARIARNLRRDGRLHDLWRGLPLLIAGLGLTGAGECVGYLVDWDVDRTPHRADTALDRLRHVRPDERRHELDERTWPTALVGT